jgi:hypothetical protein
VNFSIWDYIRQRTRDAVLSGIQDAMDFVEQGDTNGEQHAQASQLASKLNPPKGLPGEPAAVETTAEEADQKAQGAMVNGLVARKADPPPQAPQRAAQAAKPKPAPAPPPPERPKAESFDGELEQRLQDAAIPPPSPPTGRVLKDANGKPLRPRGRPRKDSGL